MGRSDNKVLFTNLQVIYHTLRGPCGSLIHDIFASMHCNLINLGLLAQPTVCLDKRKRREREGREIGEI